MLSNCTSAVPLDQSTAAPPGSDVLKLKLTCENCSRAKVKCTGPPGPCERCSGWRGLDCVFVEERKRGRPRLPEEQKKHHASSRTEPGASESEEKSLGVHPAKI